MVKSCFNIYIDSKLIEIIRIRKRRDSNFNPSELIESFLRNIFNEDLDDIEKEVEIDKIAELEKDIAIRKAKVEQIEILDKKRKEEVYKKLGFDKSKSFSKEDLKDG